MTRNTVSDREETGGGNPKPAALEMESGAGAPRKKPDLVRILIWGAAGLTGLMVAYLLVADRFTPVSGDARIRGYVVRIAAELSGRVVRVGVVENQIVAAGEMLFQIDEEAYALAVERAAAAYAAAGADVGISTAAVNSAQANVVAAEARRDLQRTLNDRIQELVSKGVLTPADGAAAGAALVQMDDAVAAAQAELEEALEQLGPDGDSDEMREARLDLQLAQLALTHTTVVAPTDGVVTNLQLGEGQFVSAGEPTMTFIDGRYAWIVANMRENNLGHLQPGTPAEIVLDAFPGRVFEARLESVGWGVATDEQTDPATGLPLVPTANDWLKPSQSFPVRLEFIGEVPEGVRFNSRASVVAYATDNPILTGLAWLGIRFTSLMSYVF